VVALSRQTDRQTERENVCGRWSHVGAMKHEYIVERSAPRITSRDRPERLSDSSDYCRRHIQCVSALETSGELGI